MPDLAAHSYTYTREEAMTNSSIHPLAIALETGTGSGSYTATLGLAGLNLHF